MSLGPEFWYYDNVVIEIGLRKQKSVLRCEYVTFRQ